MDISPDKMKTLSAAGAVLLAVYLCIQIVFFKSPEYLGISHPSQVMMILLCLCLSPVAAEPILRERFFSPWNGIIADAAIALFIGYAVLRLMPYTGMRMTQDLTNLLSGGFIYCLGRLVGRSHAGIFLRTVLIVAGLQTLLAVFYLILTGFENFEAQDRVLLFADILATQWPSISAGLVIVSVVAYALEVKRKRLLLLFVICAGVFFWFPLLVGARSVVFAIALTLIVMFLLRQAQLGKKVTIAIIFTLVAFSGLTLLPEKRLAFFGQITSFWRGSHENVMIQQEKKCVIKDNSVLIRRAMYQDALDFFVSSPWIGIGTAQYGNHSCFFGFGAHKGGDSHSLVLSVASELGLVGLAFWGLVVGWIVTHAIRSRRIHNYPFFYPTVAAWVFYVIYDQFNSSYITSIGFYLVTGYVVSTICATKSFDHHRELQCCGDH